MSHADNKPMIDELVDQLSQSQSLYVINYKGLTVSKMTNLRQRLRSSGAVLKVYKNTFMTLALKQVAPELADALQPSLSGPTACIFSKNDAVNSAKTLLAFMKENKIVELKGGIMERQYVDNSQINELSMLPSREVLISKLLMLMNSPITGFVNALQGNIRNLVYVLSAVKDKKVS